MKMCALVLALVRGCLRSDEETQTPAILGTVTELHDLTVLGYKPELRRNRSMFTLLFQSLAIAAVSA